VTVGANPSWYFVGTGYGKSGILCRQHNRGGGRRGGDAGRSNELSKLVEAYIKAHRGRRI
jgi:hypothetical protein